MGDRLGSLKHLVTVDDELLVAFVPELHHHRLVPVVISACYLLCCGENLYSGPEVAERDVRGHRHHPVVSIWVVGRGVALDLDLF